MNRGMRADPRFEEGHLAEPAMETDETVGTGCSYPASEHPQVPNETVRAGTTFCSALQPIGQLEHQGQVNATHGSAQTAYTDPKAHIAPCVPTSYPTPWPNQGQLAHLRDAGPTGDVPGAAREGSFLTSDNLHLSQVKQEARNQLRKERDVQLIAQDEEEPSYRSANIEEAADLLRHSLSANTERAYESDLRHFRDWGGRLPASADTICSYIAAHAGALSVATIQRRIATLSKAHEVAGLVNPCRAHITKATLRGLKRKFGMAQRQAKPLMRDDLFLVLDRLG